MSWTWPASDSRRKRFWPGAALLLLGVAVSGGALIAISKPEVDGSRPDHARRDAAAIRVLLRGVPQHGVVLGHGRVRVIEFIDLRCLACWRVARRMLPTLVRRYVRPRRITLELWPLESLGTQSTRAARAALAAGEQDRLWPFLAVLYADEQAQAPRRLTDAYLRLKTMACAGPGAMA